jgi:hypothetical protein
MEGKMEKVVRLEIITNKALEDEVMLQLTAAHCDKYSMIPEVHGRGRQEPRQGDSIWPEINFMLLIYCDEEMAANLIRGFGHIKKQYPLEGFRVFKSEAEIVEL